MNYEKRILGLVRKAVFDYEMIKEGDCVCVGLSGGKDSMTLLWALKKLSLFYPIKYTVKAVTIDLGYEGFDGEEIRKFCNSLDIEINIVKTYIGEIVTKIKTEERPCSVCANMRRGAVNSAAVEMGCNIVALAHNKDDVIETLLMSLFNEGRINTFSPVTYLDRTGLSVIRPLIYADEKEISSFIKQKTFAPVKNPCPYNGHTDREKAKNLLREMEKERKDVRNTVFGAVKRSDICGWRRDGQERGQNG